MREHPNILWIQTDQQSFDALSCVAGDGWFSTPQLDALAGDGVRFDRAYCANPLCVPSRTSMFSGRYSHETGVLANRGHTKGMEDFPCVGRVFADAGYATGHVGKWHMHYLEENTQQHGFEYLANSIHNGSDPGNAAASFRFLDEVRGDRPFFLVASYNNPHNICEWARGTRGDLPDGFIPEPPPLDELPPLKANHAPQIGEPDAVTLLRRSYHATGMSPCANFTERDWREYLWGYHRMVEHVDHHIGELLQGIEQRGLRESTAIVFVSDHGDAQGAHGWNQKTVLMDESARVPLIISAPGQVPSGQTTQRLVNTGIDLYPTFCDIADINAPAGLPGQSLWAHARDLRVDPGPDFVVAEAKFIQGAEIDGKTPIVEARMLRDDRYKYCVYDSGGNSESLVDMQSDPGETINLAKDSNLQPQRARLRSLLREFCRSTDDPFLNALESLPDPAISCRSSRSK